MLRLIAGRLATGHPDAARGQPVRLPIVRLIPGDPARLLAGDFATDADRRRAAPALAPERSPPRASTRSYLGGVLHGDLGRSIATATPVLPELTERFLRTLELAVAAIVVAAPSASARAS